MFQTFDFSWPVGAEQQQPGSLASTGKKSNQGQSGRIEPMEILQDQHNGLLTSHRLQEGGDLAQPALGSGTDSLSLNFETLLSSNQRRQVSQPARRGPPQALNHFLTACTATESIQ